MPTHEEPFRGVDGYKGLVNMLRGCFPDIQFAIEDMAQGKLAVIDELMAPNFAFHIPTLPDPVRGPEGMKQFVTGLRTAFPDAGFDPDYMIADEHRVAVRYQMTGTHSGSFLGAPPSGNAVKDSGTDLFHLSGGKIVSVHVAEDGLGLLQ